MRAYRLFSAGSNSLHCGLNGIGRNVSTGVASALLLALLGTAFCPQSASAAAPGPPGGSPIAIEDFVGVNLYENMWMFDGRVTNTDPIEGLDVDWGGLAEGNTGTTGIDGSFYVILELPPETLGEVIVTVTAEDGMSFAIAMYSIFPSGV